MTEVESDAWSDEVLVRRLLERGVPEVVTRIAVRGGEDFNPALGYRADSVHPSAWEVINDHPELVPMWSCNSATTFITPTGRCQVWSPESNEASVDVADYLAMVRELLTDLWEDEEDEHLEASARLLLPDASEKQLAQALTPIDRS